MNLRRDGCFQRPKNRTSAKIWLNMMVILEHLIFIASDVFAYTMFCAGKWELLPLERFPLKGDSGLVLVTESRHAAIAAKLNKPFVFDGKKKFIAQYVVTFQKNVDCGGAYMKLLTDGALKDLSQFNDKTPYTIMFGPDKCGGVAKVRNLILSARFVLCFQYQVNIA